MAAMTIEVPREPPAVTLKDLHRLDAEDPLAPFRQRFVLPEGVVYLCGNSLGALPRATPERVRKVAEDEWGLALVGAWNRHDWIGAPSRVGNKIGRLVGARSGEVIVTDSTSVNLFKLLAAALRLRPGRRVVLSEKGNFPSDLYMIQGLLDLESGLAKDAPNPTRKATGNPARELRLVPREKTLGALTEEVAVACLSHGQYSDGSLHDLKAVTARAREVGALVIWDVAHTVGVMPLDFRRRGVELAVGCSYKFMHGGPGAPAFLYVAEELQDEIRQPLSGWLGHAEPFAFEEGYRPAAGIGRMLCGTPPILSLTALEVACDLLLEADLAALRRKSRRLGEVFLSLVEERCSGLGLTLASPRDGEERGAQICLRHEHAFAVMQDLIGRGLVGDFRSPDVLRFGFAPLTVRYADLWTAVEILREVLESRSWGRQAARQPGSVVT